MDNATSALELSHLGESLNTKMCMRISVVTGLVVFDSILPHGIPHLLHQENCKFAFSAWKSRKSKSGKSREITVTGVRRSWVGDEEWILGGMGPRPDNQII